MPGTSNTVLINTSFGPFTVELYPDRAPITVVNFLRYVDENFYDGTIFHRVIDQFMIQGGGMSQSLLAKSTYNPIPLESNTGLENIRGSIAMARTNAPTSATSQFFINTVDNPFLNYQNANSPGYAVFGSVVDGMDVVDAIAEVRVATVNINGTTYQSFPYPNLISIFSVDRYALSDTLTPTTHTTSINQYGVTMASYAGSRFDYGVKINKSGVTVTKIDGQHSGEVVAGTERLQFSDKKIALDLTPDGNTGKALEFIGMLAYAKISDKAIVGEIISYFDQVPSMHDLCQMAINGGLTKALTGGDSSNTALAQLVFRNVVGHEASTGDIDSLVSYMDGRNANMTQADFLTAIAGLELNQQHVGLIGLQSTGVEYTEYLG